MSNNKNVAYTMLKDKIKTTHSRRRQVAQHNFQWHSFRPCSSSPSDSLYISLVQVVSYSLHPPQSPISKTIQEMCWKKNALPTSANKINSDNHSGLKLHKKCKNQKPWKSPWKVLSFMPLKNICIIQHYILISPHTRGIKNWHLENRTI